MVKRVGYNTATCSWIYKQKEKTELRGVRFFLCVIFLRCDTCRGLYLLRNDYVALGFAGKMHA